MIKGVHYVKVRLPKKPWPRWYVYAWRGGPCVKIWEARTKPFLSKKEVKAIIAAREARDLVVEAPLVDPTILRVDPLVAIR